MSNFDLRKYLAEGKLLKEEQMGSYRKFLKVVKSYEDEEILSDFLDSYPKGQDISKSEYERFTEKHLGLSDPEDYRGENWKYITSEGVIKENEEQGYTLYDTNVEYDNGKTGYMFQLVNSEDGEENEIGFDQLYFDDNDNRLKMGVDFKDFDQGSYQEEEVSAEEAMKMYKSLAEGKLLNEAISPQDIVDIADTVAEEFTKEDADGGIFMVYSVGKMDVDDMTFELDTDTTSQTPERILNMSNLGVGEGWGGSFRIKPKGEGYEVRNTEKGGLVAIIDNMGSFRMISNDEAKAEMGIDEGNKIK